MTSTAYRQSSRRDPKLEAIDPDNRLLGRMPVRRLEAEAVRDAILAASGRLDPTMFGPPVPVAPDEAGQVVVGIDTRDAAGRPVGKPGSLGDDEFRRSLYVQVRRSLAARPARNVRRAADDAQLRAADELDGRARSRSLLMNNEFVVAAGRRPSPTRVAHEAGDRSDGAGPPGLATRPGARAATPSRSQSAVALPGRAAGGLRRRRAAGDEDRRSPTVRSRPIGPWPPSARPCSARTRSCTSIESTRKEEPCRTTLRRSSSAAPLPGQPEHGHRLAGLGLAAEPARGRWRPPAKPNLERPVYDLKPKTPPAPPRARAMISLFMQGGPSHLDLFDPKPELAKRDGKTFTGDIKYDNAGEASAKLFGSPWKFRQARPVRHGAERAAARPGGGRRRHLA